MRCKCRSYNNILTDNKTGALKKWVFTASVIYTFYTHQQTISESEIGYNCDINTVPKSFTKIQLRFLRWDINPFLKLMLKTVKKILLFKIQMRYKSISKVDFQK